PDRLRDPSLRRARSGLAQARDRIGDGVPVRLVGARAVRARAARACAVEVSVVTGPVATGAVAASPAGPVGPAGEGRALAAEIRQAPPTEIRLAHRSVRRPGGRVVH